MAIRKAMIDFDEGVHDRMMMLAEGNGRTLRAEVLHACERHLAAPPVVKVEVEPMAPVEIVKPLKPPPKRGRPRGGKKPKEK